MGSAADVVVVGGGVIGTSIAFSLRRLGAGTVTLLERDTRLAAGASGRSGALVRTHYTNAPEAALAWAAVPWFEEFAEWVGGDSGFVNTGFLQLVDEADNDRLRDNVAMLRGLGVDTRLVEAGELRRLQPGLTVTEGQLGAYEPRSGYADPVATTEAFGAAARRLGAEVRLGVPGVALHTEGGRVTGVRTPDGVISAGTVVLANGNWSKPLLAEIGIDVPLEPYLAQRTVVRRPDSLRGDPGHLTIIDRHTGIYSRPDGPDGTLVGLSSAAVPTPSGADGDAAPMEAFQVQPGFPERARARLAEVLPAFEGAPILHSKAGPLDVTPDRCALIGEYEGIEGLVVAVGMSGSGFKKAPAIGACVAELITDGRATTAPIDPFDPGRFDRGDAIARNDYRIGGEPGETRDALVH